MVAARLRCASSTWSVNATQSIGVAAQLVRAPDLGRHGIVWNIEHVQHDPYRVGDLPRLNLARGSVDRDQFCSELGCPNVRAPSAEKLVFRMGELALAAETRDLAGEQASYARTELAFAPGLLALCEEGERQLAMTVGDDGLQDRSRPVTHSPRRHRSDLGLDCHVLTVVQPNQIG